MYKHSHGVGEGMLARIALRFSAFAEQWFPDAFVFATLAVLIVSLAALANGAPPLAVAQSFGDGFWSLITFTMQLALMVIGGYVVATAPTVERIIDRVAALPESGRGAIGLIAAVSMTVSLLNWAISLIFTALLARACARRADIRLDYRAAGAAAYVGLGSTWAMGISSSAAQMQANATSLPPSIMRIAGVIPFADTIFLWQSLAITAAIFVLTLVIALCSVPLEANAQTAQALGVKLERAVIYDKPPTTPREWLEYSPLLTLCLVALGGIWLMHEFAARGIVASLSNLNTYNFLFLLLGLLLHWRPRNFLAAVSKAVPATAGVLVQFPFYGAIAAIMTGAANAAGESLSDLLAQAFIALTTPSSFPVVVGAYSTVLGIFIPSGGGKWMLAAPYVLQAASDLKVHMGWAVQCFNAVATPNLINPFFMLPLLGVLGLKAGDIVGYTFLQFLWQLPVILLLFWLLSRTLG